MKNRYLFRVALACSLLLVLVVGAATGFAQTVDAGPLADAAAGVITSEAPAAPVAVTVEAPAVPRALNGILEILVYAVGLIAAALVSKLLYTIERRFKFDVPRAAEIALNTLLTKGIHYAEEQARKVIKTKSEALSLPDKLELAATFVMDMADSKRVTELGKERIKKLIEAHLHENREYLTPDAEQPEA